MVLQIIQHTPVWAWALLAGLVALGLAQTRTRRIGLARAIGLPAAMVALALYGVVNAFGAHAGVLLAWAVGAAATGTLARRAVAVAGARFDASSRQILVPGSWVPLALILGIFTAKYAVAVMLGHSPALAADPAFATTCSGIYGAFSGLFLTRGLSLMRLVRRNVPAAA